MLCAVGDLVEDLVAHVDEPIRTGADAAARIGRHRGGSAANVAAVAAHLTGRARFVGAVGDDGSGTRLLADLAADGVDCQGPREGRTGTILVLVTPGGERTFITDRGASRALAEVDGDVLDGVSVLHVPGYGLDGEPIAGTVRRLAREARRRSIVVAADPSSLSVGARLGVEPYRDALASLEPDVLLPNEAEAEQLDLIGRPLAPLTVATAGPRSTLVLGDGHRVRVPVPRPDRPVVDTTGAGDAFTAGFLGAWSGGSSTEEAVVAGHAAAARTIGGPGADWWDDRP